MPVHLESIELAALLGDLQEQAEPLLRRRPVALVVELPPEPVELYTDRMKVKQILLNLLSNAAKFTHEGRVTLSASVEGTGDDSRIRFTVADTGIGIESDDLVPSGTIFARWTSRGRGSTAGTGLGLSITRKLVERLEGSISVESEYGVGSTFSVWLPLREPERVIDAFRRESTPLDAAGWTGVAVVGGESCVMGAAGDPARQPTTHDATRPLILLLALHWPLPVVDCHNAPRPVAGAFCLCGRAAPGQAVFRSGHRRLPSRAPVSAVRIDRGAPVAAAWRRAR